MVPFWPLCVVYIFEVGMAMVEIIFLFIPVGLVILISYALRP